MSLTFTHSQNNRYRMSTTLAPTINKVEFFDNIYLAVKQLLDDAECFSVDLTKKPNFICGCDMSTIATRYYRGYFNAFGASIVLRFNKQETAGFGGMIHTYIDRITAYWVDDNGNPIDLFDESDIDALEYAIDVWLDPYPENDYDDYDD